jgi:hypothetical protein
MTITFAHFLLNPCFTFEFEALFPIDALWCCLAH